MACTNGGSASELKPGSYKSFEIINNSLIVDYANTWIKITPVKSGIIRGWNSTKWVEYGLRCP
jgi:hypothetical protein